VVGFVWLRLGVGGRGEEGQEGYGEGEKLHFEETFGWIQPTVDLFEAEARCFARLQAAGKYVTCCRGDGFLMRETRVGVKQGGLVRD
jgi:hypothetical protein